MALIGKLTWKVRRAIPHIPWALRHTAHVFKKRGFARGINYMQTLIRTGEDGAGFDQPIYAALPVGLVPYPHRIEVETTTKCALRCVKCEHTYWDVPHQHMTYNQFVHILDQFPKLTTVSMSGIGHNFENPDFLKMVKHACSRNLFVQFFDTFLLLNEERARKLVEYGVSKINMSIDGATKEVYEKSQVGSDFERVLTNARRLASIKKEKHSLQPDMAFTIVVSRFNQHQLPDFLDIIASIVGDSQKFTYVEFIRVFPFGKNDHMLPDFSLLPKAREDVLRKAREMKVPFKFRFVFNYFHETVTKPPVKCCQEYLVPFFTVNGTVYPCCALTEGNQRGKIDKYCPGNIFETPFRDMWYGPEYRNLMRMLRKNEIPPLCNKFRECDAFDTEHAKVYHTVIREKNSV